MSRLRSQLPVLPSLLDRLLDDEPGRRQEVARPAATVLADLKANIRRDLENLLNTRLPLEEAWLTPYPQLRRSLLNYGLPDFSTVVFGDPAQREQFRLTVQYAIERFEPRLRQIRVEVDQEGDEHARTLYLKITALLMVEPDPVPLLLDSRVHTPERLLRLRELRYG